ncbi:MAG: hypothetical protein H6625_12090 [Bdellovibrionaceae bacterium]|nr:hypothetical protein [Pseudobdellovibrionaceae bacterium]
MKVSLMILGFGLFFGNFAYSDEDECSKKNIVIAQAVLDHAASSINNVSSPILPSEVIYESGDRFEYYGNIDGKGKASYKIVVNTDADCFLKSIELIDMSTRPRQNK